MESNQPLLKYSLYAGAVYFLGVSVAHLFGIKVPGLFIYYNISSYQYQDNIISFLAFGWASYFYAAAKNQSILIPLLLASFMALLGLININIATDFNAIEKGISSLPFWIQTALLGIYVLWLLVLFLKNKR